MWGLAYANYVCAIISRVCTWLLVNFLTHLKALRFKNKISIDPEHRLITSPLKPILATTRILLFVITTHPHI